MIPTKGSCRLPRRPGLDHSAAFLRQGHAFIPATCDRLQTDGFRARLMLHDVTCLRGPAAVALVYSDAVTRKRSVGALRSLRHAARSPILHRPADLRPSQSLSWRDESNTFSPQGGGRVVTSHRCPGEWITVELIAEAVAQLAADPGWTLPDRDLGIALNRLPARPASGVRLRFQG